MSEIDNEAAIDAWHDGWFAFRNKAPCPYGEGMLATAWHEGRREGERASRVRVEMPERPEGYYHTRLNDH